MAKASVEDRFWARVDKTDGCWYWTGLLNENGYGWFHPSRRLKRSFAHRFVYELLVGPIPEHLRVDHECHNQDDTCPGGSACFHRSCVRPDHLRLRNIPENAMRSRLHHTHRTHCPAGHAYTEDNTSWWRGHRKCRTCHARRERERRARQ